MDNSSPPKYFFRKIQAPKGDRSHNNQSPELKDEEKKQTYEGVRTPNKQGLELEAIFGYAWANTPKDEGDRVRLAAFGQTIKNEYPDFAPRNYSSTGDNRILPLIKEFFREHIVITTDNCDPPNVFFRLVKLAFEGVRTPNNQSPDLATIFEFGWENTPKEEGGWVRLDEFSRTIKQQYPSFRTRDYSSTRKQTLLSLVKEYYGGNIEIYSAEVTVSYYFFRIIGSEQGRDRNSNNPNPELEAIFEYGLANTQKGSDGWIDMGQFRATIRMEFPDFTPRYNPTDGLYELLRLVQDIFQGYIETKQNDSVAVRYYFRKNEQASEE
jgi:hypothetical protein